MPIQGELHTGGAGATAGARLDLHGLVVPGDTEGGGGGGGKNWKWELHRARGANFGDWPISHSGTCGGTPRTPSPGSPLS